ncbi:MAG: hypothetical protein KDB22_15270 [Planctomycetales bacterium]|nr:hypothetical protein [Planctomycetales bacterium]
MLNRSRFYLAVSALAVLMVTPVFAQRGGGSGGGRGGAAMGGGGGCQSATGTGANALSSTPAISPNTLNAALMANSQGFAAGGNPMVAMQQMAMQYQMMQRQMLVMQREILRLQNQNRQLMAELQQLDPLSASKVVDLTVADASKLVSINENRQPIGAAKR